MDDTGIEPVTPTMSMWCSTAEPIVPIETIVRHCLKQTQGLRNKAQKKSEAHGIPDRSAGRLRTCTWGWQQKPGWKRYRLRS